MPLFMDVQTFGPDVALSVLVEAYEADLSAHTPLGLTLLRYWISEPARKAFCLIEADHQGLLTVRRLGSSSRTAHEIYPISEHVLLVPEDEAPTDKEIS